MAKKQEIEVKQNGSTAIVPASLRGGAVLDGDDRGLTLGRMAMYHGTTEEQNTYEGCDFKAGDFIDVLEKRKLASARIVIVHGFVSYVKWPQGAKTPDYVVRKVSEIPPEDVEDAWKMRQINCVVLVDGEPWPYLCVFKRTGLKAGETIFQLEGRRTAAGKVRGCYELGSQKAKSEAGQTYHQLTQRPVGDCPESLFDLLFSCLGQIDVVKAKADEAASEQGGSHDDDTIPI